MSSNLPWCVKVIDERNIFYNKARCAGPVQEVWASHNLTLSYILVIQTSKNFTGVTGMQGRRERRHGRSISPWPFKSAATGAEEPFHNIITGIQVCALHDGGNQRIDQQNFNRKSISRIITHPQPWNLQVKLTGIFTFVTLAFQLFTRKLCLQISGLRMRNFTWNRFPIKK